MLLICVLLRSMAFSSVAPNAVSMTIAIVEKDRTCNMMTISIAAIIAGKILPSAVLALVASSMDPPISMR